jgi:hypothetical protein
MKYKKLIDTDYHDIKQAILDPDSSPLSTEQQKILERLASAAKILDRYPVKKSAVKILQAKYNGLSRAQAYRDFEAASRLFNSYHTFDYEFWHTWVINDIALQIQAAKDKGDLMAWNRGHSRLIQAIGSRPNPELDPKLIEKHTFIIQIKDHECTLNINTDILQQIPARLREKLAASLYVEINEDQAKKIMNS